MNKECLLEIKDNVCVREEEGGLSIEGNFGMD